VEGAVSFLVVLYTNVNHAVKGKPATTTTTDHDYAATEKGHGAPFWTIWPHVLWQPRHKYRTWVLHCRAMTSFLWHHCFAECPLPRRTLTKKGIVIMHDDLLETQWSQLRVALPRDLSWAWPA
jgi:hypothetical protein